MNSLTIIGNLTRDPERRATISGEEVTNFDVAVNRFKGGEQEVTYFRVSAWGKTGANCAQYLAKGRKVCVVGQVSVDAYTGKDGKPHAQINVTAQQVEFLSGNTEQAAPEAAPAQQPETPAFTPVTDEDLPF